jgi:PhoH-like ATPase
MSSKKSPNSKGVKNYVLDTNVLLHDPESILKFEDNRVVLPVEVLMELDSKKTAPGELGRNAREVQRKLRSLFGVEPMEPGHAMVVKTETGGTISVVINEWLINHQFVEGLQRLKTTLIHLDTPDNRILGSALYVKEKDPTVPTILVTKDINMALKGQALGLGVQDYKNDKIITSEADSYQTIKLTSKQWDKIADLKTDIRDKTCYTTGVKYRSINKQALVLGEYIIATVEGAEGYVEPLRYLGENTFRPLPIYAAYVRGNHANGDLCGLKMPGGIHVIPRNVEQWILMDALLDPTTPLVTVKSKAGTGKTFIAIATAIHEIISEHTAYEKVFITRPNVDMGKGIGFLPGEQDDKMRPYMQPYYDNLDILFPSSKKKGIAVKKDPQANAHNAPVKTWEKFKQLGIMEIQPLNSIRGRSLPNCLILVDESQNLTPIHAKTIATRIGEGAKVVFMGDPTQIDTPYLDAHSNGLVYVRERMKGQLITAHVKLVKGVRSQIAEICAELL